MLKTTICAFASVLGRLILLDSSKRRDANRLNGRLSPLASVLSFWRGVYANWMSQGKDSNLQCSQKLYL